MKRQLRTLNLYPPYILRLELFHPGAEHNICLKSKIDDQIIPELKLSIDLTDRKL